MDSDAQEYYVPGCHFELQACDQPRRLSTDCSCHRQVEWSKRTTSSRPWHLEEIISDID